jgi:outer membrane cobalamin receptor
MEILLLAGFFIPIMSPSFLRRGEKMPFKKTAALTLILCALCAFVFSEDDAVKKDNSVKKDSKVQVKETITVIGKPIIESIDLSRNAIKKEVITKKQIEGLNAFDIATATYKIPGISISRHNFVGAFGGGDGGALFIRGQGSSRPGQEIGTMIDGVPRFSGIWTHSLLDMLPIGLVDSLEIYKSPQPVLFGNMGFAIVNIVPKRVQTLAASGKLELQYGSYNTTVLSAEYGERTEGYDYYLSGSHMFSEGHRDNSSGGVDSLYGRLGIKTGSQSELSFNLYHTDSDVQDPLAETASADAKPDNFKTKSTMLTVKYVHPNPWGDGFVQLYFDDGYQDYLQNNTGSPLPLTSISDYLNYGARFSESLNLFNGNELMIGFDYHNYGGKFREENGDIKGTISDISFENIAPYVMINQSLQLRNMVITASCGSRINFNNYYNTETAYQAGLKFDFSSISIYGNFSHAFNLPGVYAAILFKNGLNPDYWQTLEAEHMNNWEVGILHNIAECLDYSVTYFSGSVTDALRVTFPGPKYMNVGNYDVKGVEFTIDLTPAQFINMFFGGSLQTTTPDDFPYTPGYTFTAGLNIAPFENLGIDLIIQAVDEHYTGDPRTPAKATVLVEDYVLCNANISYNIQSLLGTSNRAVVFLFIENLGNTKYYLKPGYPMPGTTTMAGFRISL